MADLMDNALFVELMGVGFNEDALASVFADESRHQELLEMLDAIEADEGVAQMAAPIRALMARAHAEISDAVSEA